MDTSKQRGNFAERVAFEYLKQHRLKPIARNYRTRMGEIDIIMQDGEELVFVEVRYRAASGHGTALDTVNRFKQRKILQTAKYYLVSNGKYDKIPCRFDIIAIDGADDINWIKHAFTVDDGYD